MSTIRQERLKSKILENAMLKKPKPFRKVATSVGYSQSYADTNLKKTKAVKTFVEQVKELRDNAKDELLKRKDKLQIVDYNDIVGSLVSLSKLVELLESRPTERISFDDWTPEELEDYVEKDIIPRRIIEKSRSKI